MFTQRQRDRHRYHFVQTRLADVRVEQNRRIARAVDTMTSQHYGDPADPEASRAVCEVMGQARQAGKVLDDYLDEWAALRKRLGLATA